MKAIKPDQYTKAATVAINKAAKTLPESKLAIFYTMVADGFYTSNGFRVTEQDVGKRTNG